MYNEEFQEMSCTVESLFLDPNNPRFWTQAQPKQVPESKIPDNKVQQNTQSQIEKFGVEDLYYSILRNGFLPLDRIVVRPINGHPEKYVAVEGNRRLAALKWLRRRLNNHEIEEEGIDDAYLNKLEESTRRVQILLYRGTESDISWILQGIRHISGIKEWQPAQRARLVVQQIEEHTPKLMFGQAGQKFGLSAKAVGRLYRAYKGLQQMQSDADYGSRAKNEYFSLFEEVLRNRKVREWFGWDESINTFTNGNALQQFYSWITPDDEHEGKRRIHDPKHVQHLAVLLEKQREDLIGEIDRHETTIEEAYGRAKETPGKYDWQTEIEKARKAITSLPNQVFLESPQELKDQLVALRKILEQTLQRLNPSPT